MIPTPLTTLTPLTPLTPLTHLTPLTKRRRWRAASATRRFGWCSAGPSPAPLSSTSQRQRQLQRLRLRPSSVAALAAAEVRQRRGPSRIGSALSVRCSTRSPLVGALPATLAVRPASRRRRRPRRPPRGRARTRASRWLFLSHGHRRRCSMVSESEGGHEGAALRKWSTRPTNPNHPTAYPTTYPTTYLTTSHSLRAHSRVQHHQGSPHWHPAYVFDAQRCPERGDAQR